MRLIPLINLPFRSAQLAASQVNNWRLFLLPVIGFMPHNSGMYKFDIVFFYTGENAKMPSALVASARAAFGREITIIQASDQSTPAADGISGIARFNLGDEVMLARAQAFAELKITRPTLFLDADMLIIQPFELPPISNKEVGTITRAVDIIANSPEIAEKYPEFFGMSMNKVMPYLGCLIFTQSARFLSAVYNRMTDQPEHLRRWFGDQIALRDELSGKKFKSVPLHPMHFNHVINAPHAPHQIMALRSAGVKILHAKGRTNKTDILLASLSSTMAISILA